jgi:sulfite reductase (NADPH) flavoprotein alpha-component
LPKPVLTLAFRLQRKFAKQDSVLLAKPPTTFWNREQPYVAHLHEHRALTTPAAVKQVRHIEIELGDSGITYEPGDTLAIRIQNDPTLAAEIMSACGLTDTPALLTSLQQQYELTQVHPGFFKHYGIYCQHPGLQQLLADSKQLRGYLEHKQILDVLQDFPAALTAEQLLSCLRHLQDRQYSIASSQRVTPHTVALTVGLVQFSNHGAARSGAGSSFLSERVVPATPLPVYVVANPNFRLPLDPATAVIMIGPGTGIAPFRAFLQERHSIGASGRHWLLAGNRRRSEDFLYGIAGLPAQWSAHPPRPCLLA